MKESKRSSDSSIMSFKMRGALPRAEVPELEISYDQQLLRLSERDRANKQH
jgi:hypothetical protein